MLDSDLLSPSRILTDIRLKSKKRLLEFISVTLAKKNPDLSSRQIFQKFCDREHLGSTALGNGIAIPHGRTNGAESVEALFLQLSTPLPFNAQDGKPVDLVFALAIPEGNNEDYSKLLSGIAERFSDQVLLDQLRSATDANEIWQLLSNANS